MKFLIKASLLLTVLLSVGAAASPHMGIEPSEFEARRRAIMAEAGDGILLLHSISAPKDWSDTGFQQDTNFFYLTGLENLHDAILAIDGETHQSWLFVMVPSPREQRMYAPLSGWNSAFLSPSTATEQLLRIDHVVPWDQFTSFIDERRKANPKLAFYLDQGGEGKMVADISDPPDLAPVENNFTLWTSAIKTKWPDAKIIDATQMLKAMRAVKSPAEVALMRKAAGYTDVAFRAAITAMAPGRTNRQIEGAAVKAAMDAGADGIGMWPELKGGSTVSGSTVYQKSFDYHLLNRRLSAGETLLMDLGFSHEFYKGDVGRTLPVSGRFLPDQREVIDFMDAAYHAGVRSMRDGASSEDVIQAATRYVVDHSETLHSELARKAAAKLINPKSWIMYSHGMDPVEIWPVKQLQTGYTVAFGPDFDVDGVGFYEEDVFLIEPQGEELINPPLPNTAAEIERTMATLKRAGRQRHR